MVPSETRSGIVFTVYGQPVAQGSKKVIRGHLIEMADARLRSWRQDVAAQAHQQMETRPWTGGIDVALTFWLPRPKNHYGTGKNAERLKASSPSFPAVHPDIDKLTRSVLDALTGICFEDDRQVVGLVVTKRYADGQPVGMTCSVIPTLPDDAP